MATKETGQLAKLTIPAGYLEDVRSALVEEVRDDADALKAGQADVIEVAFGHPHARGRREDRASAASWLDRDLRMLTGLLDATGDTQIAGEPAALGHALEALVRVLRARLKQVTEYGPMPMRDVLDLADELRWAATEAIRICPGLDDRLEAAS